MLIGTDLTTETTLADSLDENLTEKNVEKISEMEIDKVNTVGKETNIKIITGEEACYINGKPITMADITGKIIGAPDLPKRTRTIEDKAYTIR